MADGLWPLLTALSFWGWVGVAVVFILSVFPVRGEFRVVPASRWGALWLLLFLLWVVSMARA